MKALVVTYTSHATKGEPRLCFDQTVAHDVHNGVPDFLEGKGVALLRLGGVEVDLAGAVSEENGDWLFSCPGAYSECLRFRVPGDIRFHDGECGSAVADQGLDVAWTGMETVYLAVRRKRERGIGISCGVVRLIMVQGTGNDGPNGDECEKGCGDRKGKHTDRLKIDLKALSIVGTRFWLHNDRGHCASAALLRMSRETALFFIAMSPMHEVRVHAEATARRIHICLDLFGNIGRAKSCRVGQKASVIQQE